MPLMQSIEVGQNKIFYEEAGQGDTLLLLSGWCQDQRLFKRLMPILAKSHRVISMDWRGHGPDRKYDGDFTIAEQTDDLIAFVDRRGLDRLALLSTSHGGWANLEACDRLGAERVPRTIVIDWLMIDPGAAFLQLLDDLQVEDNWIRGRKDFFDTWIVNTDNKDVIDHVNNEMASFDFEMWARSGREIARAYRRWDYPLNRMAALSPHRKVMHILSQPQAPTYKEAQDTFAAEHNWFVPQKIPGATHFPTLESPALVAGIVDEFLK
jgi:pimeloyl-ACP methyl ester carboxylesterase